MTWESYQYEYDPISDRIQSAVVGRYIQYPLMLAWAVTIHKGQGKTLERVRVDLGSGAFAAGQVYVALSRCRAIEDITLARPIRPEEVICDARVRRFYDALRGATSAESKPELDPLQNLGLSVGGCPTCGSPLRKRNGRRGPFMGCSQYPACRYTRNA